MKRMSLIALLILICSIPGYSQFWIEFGWHDPQCRQCMSMAQSLHLSHKQARDYQKVVHKYGQKIEKEARKDYRYWDKSARKIFDLRMDRDRKIQRILSPHQFSYYISYSQERPQRIHDYRGWYENPRYKGYRHSPDWRHLEDRYWSYHWNIKPAPRKEPRYDNRPNNSSSKKSPSQKGRQDNRRNDNSRDRDNNNGRSGRR